jgi:ABC-type multidrug transport system fused ATPase/permease subunit
LIGGAWLSTHWLLRESGVWRDRDTKPVRAAQRQAEYAYRLAVDAPAAKEIRVFGLASWVVARFRTSRLRLFELRDEATRLRERPLLGSVLIVMAANVFVFWSIGTAAADHRIALDALVRYASAAAGTYMIAFGGLSWALDGAAAPAGAVARLGEAMRRRGDLVRGTRLATGLPAREIRFREVSFAYTPGAPLVLDRVDLTIAAGTSLALVGVNGAGKTTIAKLLCRLYDPQQGAIEIDGIDLRELDIESWRTRLSAVFQDFTRFEWPLRDNVAPRGGRDEAVQDALSKAGADRLASLDTVLGRGYTGGTDLSGGQWQRVAIARALCAVSLGAGVVLLDEPTAQLDVRGEAEIFERVLAATRHATTILISHRFSTVRQADRIVVLEHGRIIESGSHRELMAAGGRYRAMFDLQALPFSQTDPGASHVVA